VRGGGGAEGKEFENVVGAETKKSNPRHEDDVKIYLKERVCNIMVPLSSE
jgi:hypothetical protein